ncbi:MAG TPA: Maf family protein [Halanaerobiales bacterium]|nr:Maf family protein [Halanaerobiales bacterium]
MIDKKIILASSSDRRKELLTRLGIKYTAMPSKIDEDGYDYEHPDKLVQELSLAKASNVANVVENALIIAADTVVAHNNKILGKPEDEEDAKRMLQLLENDKHEVFTGLALISADDEMHFLDYDVTEVFMRKVEKEEIERYIKTGEPMDKAGSYGIQGKGGIFVNKIVGSYFTVMGLPIHLLSMALKSFSIEII